MIRGVFRALLRLLPSAFRTRHGGAMEDAFSQRLDEAHSRGRAAVAVLLFREAADLAWTALRTRASALRRKTGALSHAVRGTAGDTWSPGNPSRPRGGGLLRGLADDARQAVRSLARRPAFTLFAAGTVALGIGATSAVFSVVEGVLLRPVPFEGGDRMVGLWRTVGSSRYVTPSAGMVEAWSQQDDLFETVEPYAIRYMTLTGAGDALQVQAGLIRPSYPDFLGTPPALGRVFGPEEAARGERVVMLGHHTWRERFGADPGVLGSTLTLDGEPWTVVGVMAPDARLVAFELMNVEVWRPLTPEIRSQGVSVVGLMRPGVTLEAVNARLETLDEGLRAGGSLPSGSASGALLLRGVYGRNLADALTLLSVAVALLLAVACVNVSNLLLHRAASRRRETAVRAALGGGRRRLARQMLAESLLLALVGGGAGIALAYGGVEAMLALRPPRLSTLDGVGVNGRVLAFTGAVTAGTGILFGLLPAWLSTRPSVLDSLRTGVRSDDGVPGRRTRWLLVTGEIALSFPLLLGSVAALGSLSQLERADPGFRAEEVVVLDVILPEWRYHAAPERDGFFEEMRMRLESLPGVGAVAAANRVPPGTGIWFGRVEAEGSAPTDESVVLHGPSVDPAYFAAAGQPLLEGRAFTAEEVREEADVLVIGEGTARRFFPDGDAVGRRLRVDDGDWRTVVGVTGDVAMNGLSPGPRPLQVYHTLRGGASQRAFLVRAARPGGIDTLLPLVRQAATGLDPEVRIDGPTTARDRMLDTLARERFTGLLLAAFAGLALVLAAVGLFGVVSQVVGRRTREIGIRMALGARARSVALMVLRSGTVATAVGIVLGAGLAWAGLSRLESLLGGSGQGPLAWAGTAAALAATALLAAWLPARRATRIDPREALSTD